MGIILPDVCKSRLFTLDVSELYPSLLPFVHPWLVPASHVVESIETFHRTEGYTAGVMMFKWFDQVLMHQIITDFQEFRKIWCTCSILPEILLIEKILQQLGYSPHQTGHDFTTMTDSSGKLASPLEVTKLMFITGQRDSPMTKNKSSWFITLYFIPIKTSPILGGSVTSYIEINGYNSPEPAYIGALGLISFCINYNPSVWTLGRRNRTENRRMIFSFIKATSAGQFPRIPTFWISIPFHDFHDFHL